jgi:flagellar hook-associated protein 2
MGRISTGIGLVSGINHKDIIDQLMQLESRPKDLLQTRIDSTNQQKLAFTDLLTRLSQIKIFGTTMKKPQTFAAATTTSSDENVLTAAAANGAAIGSFQFQVARLVTTQQAVSAGFTDITGAKVGAGTITVEMGGGEVSSQTPLAQLRGGSGIRRGLFRIADAAGKTAVIDLSAAVNLNDVIKKINTSLDVTVRASIDGDRIKLTDLSGGPGTLSVMDLADGHAAEDLGLAGQTPASGVITGADIHFLGRATTLSAVNDARGIRKASTGNDLAITVGGSTINVSLAAAKTIGDAIDAINTAAAGQVTATIDPGANGIKLTAAGAITVANVGDSKAATDLGIEGAGGATVNGKAVLAGMNTVLLSSLNGGQGMTLGSIQITNAAGQAATVDLSAVTTVQQVLDAISNSGINVKGALNASGNGIQVIDNSTGTGALTIAEASGGTTAADLGLLGSAAAGANFLSGKNLQRQWVSENTLLSAYNGGRGVAQGKFKITNSNGVSATIDLSTGAKTSLGDVIRDINNRAIGITASVNAHGDGLLLTDTAGGGLRLKVENFEGTPASDLNIVGEAAQGQTTIDGSFEKTLTLDANDTLTSVQKKLTDLNWGVISQVINDGSGTAPFRLSLTAKNAGRNGRVVFDGGTTQLGTRNLVEAQDAAVFLGGADTADPLLIIAGKNQLSGVIKGVTIDLHGVSDKPVTLNVTRDTEKLVEDTRKFVDDFNQLSDKIKELTKFDPDTKEKGLLLGDATVSTVEASIFAVLNTVVAGAGKYRILSDVGIKLGQDSQVEFDEDKFRAAYADDPDAVQKLFTTAAGALGEATPISQLNKGRGVRALGNGLDDLKLTFRDGTSAQVSLDGAQTLQQIVDAINTAAGAKAKVELRSDGEGLRLTDLTGATTAALKAESVNGSQAVFDLRLTGAANGAILDGGKIVDTTATNAGAGGVAWAIEAMANKLTDPVTGVITRENKSLDARTRQFEDRIEVLDKLLQSKRERLERQFASMETVLAQLQSQQAALGQMQTIQPVQQRKSA